MLFLQIVMRGSCLDFCSFLCVVCSKACRYSEWPFSTFLCYKHEEEMGWMCDFSCLRKMMSWFCVYNDAGESVDTLSSFQWFLGAACLFSVNVFSDCMCVFVDVSVARVVVGVLKVIKVLQCLFRFWQIIQHTWIQQHYCTLLNDIDDKSGYWTFIGWSIELLSTPTWVGIINSTCMRRCACVFEVSNRAVCVLFLNLCLICTHRVYEIMKYGAHENTTHLRSCFYSTLHLF